MDKGVEKIWLLLLVSIEAIRIEKTENFYEWVFSLAKVSKLFACVKKNELYEWGIQLVTGSKPEEFERLTFFQLTRKWWRTTSGSHEH